MVVFYLLPANKKSSWLKAELSSTERVKIDASSNYNLTDEQVKELIEVGFNSGDIYEILNSNTPLANAYTQKGKKENPNAIIINVGFSGTDPCKLALYNLIWDLGMAEF